MNNTIATFGEILVEIMATQIDQSFLSSGPYPSGAPAIFINQVGLLGEPSRIYSVVGDDDFGRLNINRLLQNGVDTSYIYTTQDRATGVVFVRYNKDGSRNFIYHIDNASCGLLHYDNSPKAFLNSVSYLHIMGTSLYNDALMDIALKYVDIAKQSGANISFDANIRPEIIRSDAKKLECLKVLATKSDIFFAGKEENQWLLNTRKSIVASQAQEMELVDILYSYGVSYIIIKDAEKGATLYSDKKKIEQKAISVPCVDPTGAGDRFAGAFIAAINKGMDGKVALRYATIAGGMAVSKQGPMEGICCSQK